MNKKEERYQKDFKETFGEKASDKQAFSMVESLKKIHKNAYPSKEFKIDLKSKLDKIYEVGLTQNEIPRWSIFQIFTVLGSFIFIFGALLIFLDLQSIHKNNIGEEIRIEKNIPENRLKMAPDESIRIMDSRMMDIPQNDAFVPESYEAQDISPSNISSDEVAPMSDMPTGGAAESMMMQSTIMSDDMGAMSDDMGESEDSYDEFVALCESNSGSLNEMNNECVFEYTTCSYDSYMGYTQEQCPYFQR